MDRWPRRATFEFFKDYEDPFFNFTANVDVTAAVEFCRDRSLKISLALLYWSLKAANSIPEFRHRLRDGNIVEFDIIHATQTILNEDDTFSFAYYGFEDDIFEFNILGAAATEKYRRLRSFDVETGRLDLIYYSSIPWVSFTSFKHASRLDKLQTIPKIVFGKIFGDAGRLLLPVSVEANHVIMDGVHVGRFFESFQRSLRAY